MRYRDRKRAFLDFLIFQALSEDSESHARSSRKKSNAKPLFEFSVSEDTGAVLFSCCAAIGLCIAAFWALIAAESFLGFLVLTALAVFVFLAGATDKRIK